MALTDVTGFFSRYFIVGFFIPAYISLVSLWLTATSRFIPDALENHSQGTQLLILGGLAIVLALALSGVSTGTLRLFEGYWPFVPRRIYAAACRVQTRKYHRLRRLRESEDNDSAARARAALLLDRNFSDRPDRILPTRLGNIFQAAYNHSNVRWGLDGVTIWPRVETVLSDGERQLLLDAKIDFYVLINSVLGAYVVGVCLFLDKWANGSRTVPSWLSWIIALAIGFTLLRVAEAPALNWGENIRSSIDLHRLEIYEKLGVRSPTSFSDERELAKRVSQALLFGQPLLSDDLWGPRAGADD